jgi:hypothetical protein
LIRLIAVACVLLIPSAAVAGELAAMAASSRAMACCEAMKHGCAGIKSPDDCCQLPQASIVVVSPLNTPGVRATASATPVAVLSSQRGDIVAMASTIETIDVQFKRPHDPPHLHLFHLLI